MVVGIVLRTNSIVLRTTRPVTASSFSVACFVAKKPATKQPTTKLPRSGSVVRNMICEKCSKQFESEVPLSQSGKMFGLCNKHGTRLKYDDIPEGFVGGVVLGLTSTPIFFLALFNWVFLVATIFVAGLTCAGVWFTTKKLGGVLATHSIEEYKKSNIGLSFLSGTAGFSFILLWCILAFQVLA